MTPQAPLSSFDSTSGYSSATKIYHSLRSPIPLPPRATLLSISDYVISLLHTSPHFSPSFPLLIDADSGSSLSYSSFLRQIDSLSSSLSPIPARHVALIFSPPSFHIPVLYFSLLSLNVVVSPANPLSTSSELTHLVSLSNPSIIFTVSSLLPKFSSSVVNHVRVILLDSPEFDSMLTHPSHLPPRPRVAVPQDSSAAILYSSGTTGRVKGVELTHRNLIALIAGYYYRYQEEDELIRNTRQISLVPLPMFHVFGFSMLLRAVTLSETMVMMKRFDFEKMLAAVEKYKVRYMPVSPPLIVALSKSELVNKYDICSIRRLGCGGAPLGKEVAQRFKARFPDVDILQVPPAELEHLLLSHPEIADAAVVPYPDEEAGEIPMAFVVRKPGGSISGSQVMDYVAKQVTPYKRIRRIAFVSAIPKNPSGKILRRELVNQAIGGSSKL